MEKEEEERTYCKKCKHEGNYEYCIQCSENYTNEYDENEYNDLPDGFEIDEDE